MSCSNPWNKTRCSSISFAASSSVLFALFEDRLAKTEESSAWLFENPLECLDVFDGKSLAAALIAVGRGDAWWVVALDYELGYLFEPAAAPPGWHPRPNRSLARFWRFASSQKLTADGVESWLQAFPATYAEGESVAGVGGISPRQEEEHYRHAIKRIQEYIAAGDCYQVNYTFPLHFQWFGHPLALYKTLRRQQPVGHGGIVTAEEGSIVSLSPELFVERCGNRLVTRPMKGTAPRSGDPVELQQSEKNRAENVMIVDLLRNDLGRIALNGSVQVDSLFQIEDYPTVWQMVSQVSAEVADCDFGTILKALFPCGSITGAPKVRAMQIAAELEGQPRRIYTGSLGWIAPGGNFRLNVAIRTLDLDADGSGHLGIGSGIVADSDAAEEWQECLLKSAFLSNLDPGLQLIETLRREDGVYPRLHGHLARLKASAAWFGFPFDAEGIRGALEDQPVTGLLRVRLTLSKNGDIEINHAPLLPELPDTCLARLAVQPVDSRNPLRRHKTTARKIYDAALAEIAATPEVFDVVFLNERNEVVEGARTNVFIERNGVLLTPPLSSGALPGVLRAELLSKGLAREAVLQPADLAAGFFLGNALRGLIPCRLMAV